MRSPTVAESSNRMRSWYAEDLPQQSVGGRPDQRVYRHGVVIGQQAQLTLGHNTGSLNLVLDDGGLAGLIEIAVDAWTRWQAVPTGELANFKVTKTEVDRVANQTRLQPRSPSAVLGRRASPSR